MKYLRYAPLEGVAFPFHRGNFNINQQLVNEMTPNEVEGVEMTSNGGSVSLISKAHLLEHLEDLRRQLKSSIHFLVS